MFLVIPKMMVVVMVIECMVGIAICSAHTTQTLHAG